MTFEDLLKSLYMVWPLKEKSEEWCVFLKYLEGIQVEEEQIDPVASEVQSEPKDEHGRY